MSRGAQQDEGAVDPLRAPDGPRADARGPVADGDPLGAPPGPPLPSGKAFEEQEASLSWVAQILLTLWISGTALTVLSAWGDGSRWTGPATLVVAAMLQVAHLLRARHRARALTDRDELGETFE